MGEVEVALPLTRAAETDGSRSGAWSLRDWTSVRSANDGDSASESLPQPLEPEEVETGWDRVSGIVAKIPGQRRVAGLVMVTEERAHRAATHLIDDE